MMLYRIDFKHFFGCRATLFNDHGCGYPVFGQINHKLGVLVFCFAVQAYIYCFCGHIGCASLWLLAVQLVNFQVFAGLGA